MLKYQPFYTLEALFLGWLIEDYDYGNKFMTFNVLEWYVWPYLF